MDPTRPWDEARVLRRSLAVREEIYGVEKVIAFGEGSEVKA